MISYWELAVWNKLFCRKFNKNRITKLCDGPSNRQLYLHSISVKAHVFCIRCVRARYIIVWVWELDDADIFDIWWSKSCGSAWERVGARGSEHKLKVSNLIQTIFRMFIYTKVNFGWFPNMKKTVEAPEKVVFENKRCDHTKGFLWFYVFTTVRKQSISWGKMLAETKLKWLLDPNSPRSNGNVRFLRINQYISEWWVDRRAPTPLPHNPLCTTWVSGNLK